MAIKLTVASMQAACGGCFLLINLWRQNKFHKYKQFVSPHTSPKPPKYSRIFSSGVSGDKPPTKIFLTGSFVFMALALFGSMTFPFSLCSFWSMTWGKWKHNLTQFKLNVSLMFWVRPTLLQFQYLDYTNNLLHKIKEFCDFWTLSTDTDSSDNWNHLLTSRSKSVTFLKKYCTHPHLILKPYEVKNLYFRYHKGQWRWKLFRALYLQHLKKVNS